MQKLNVRLMRSKSWCWILMFLGTFLASNALAVPLPGGTLDPLTIPKYVQPLVIPPVMPASTVQPAVLDADGEPVAVPAANYNIAVRQFKQQILPGGIWGSFPDANGNLINLPATPVWSYGPTQDQPAYDATGASTYVAPAPLGTQGANFNYPAFTVENTSGVPTTVRWINDLKNPITGNFLPHILTGTVDQTLHWANPTNSGCINTAQMPQTDCATENPAPYTGPVPIVTHVHGAHVNAESDGYPEAWWLADASNIPLGYKTTGTLYTQNDMGLNVQGAGNPIDFDPVGGAAFYSYENTQPATTLWYHDHTLGMTRLNVYAGPAGFWLVRGGAYDAGTDLFTGGAAVLPGPAPSGTGDPNFNAAYRQTIREIPIAIQDRSFNADGTLFYPNSRTFFDGFNGPYIGSGQSDIAPTWNPEAFFNTMVVNGTTWPKLEVAPARYRLRMLNGSNSRFLNLAMFQVDPVTGGLTAVELPFYQIGADQGFLQNVVEIRTGFLTPVDPAVAQKIGAKLAQKTAQINAEIVKLQAKAVGAKPKKVAQIEAEIAKLQVKISQKTQKAALKLNKAVAVPIPAPAIEQALLMAPAERADVIVDFSGLANGTIIRMINTAPDAPFGGFPDIPADVDTSGQVMQFVVNHALTLPADAMTTSPLALALVAEPVNPNLSSVTRPLSLVEEESQQVCVTVDPTGALVTVASFPTANPNIAADCAALGAVPQAPKAALLGIIQADPTQVGSPLVGVPLMWKDPITENPALGATETWEFYNLTVDGHPIHMHLVRYEIIDRQLFDPLSPTFATVGPPIPPLPTEMGKKDTVLAYPGEITRVKATFDLPGLYVWHCHIVEHEDNEMMRPFYVGTKPAGFPVP